MSGTIVVDRLTPAAEALPLIDVLRNQGQAGLAAALRGRHNRRLRLGALDYTLDLISGKPLEKDGYRLVVVTTRPIKLAEKE